MLIEREINDGWRKLNNEQVSRTIDISSFIKDLQYHR